MASNVLCRTFTTSTSICNHTKICTLQAPRQSHDQQCGTELVKSCVAPVIMQHRPVAVRPGARGYVLHGDILYNHLRTINCNMLPDSSKQERSMTCRGRAAM